MTDRDDLAAEAADYAWPPLGVGYLGETEIDPEMLELYRGQDQIRRAADLAPGLLGEELGHAVALVLLNNSEHDFIDPDIGELAHVILRLASEGKRGLDDVEASDE